METLRTNKILFYVLWWILFNRSCSMQIKLIKINHVVRSKMRSCSPSFYQLVLELNFVFHAILGCPAPCWWQKHTDYLVGQACLSSLAAFVSAHQGFQILTYELALCWYFWSGYTCCWWKFIPWSFGQCQHVQTATVIWPVALFFLSWLNKTCVKNLILSYLVSLKQGDFSKKLC